MCTLGIGTVPQAAWGKCTGGVKKRLLCCSHGYKRGGKGGNNKPFMMMIDNKQ